MVSCEEVHIKSSLKSHFILLLCVYLCLCMGVHMPQCRSDCMQSKNYLWESAFFYHKIPGIELRLFAWWQTPALCRLMHRFMLHLFGVND